MILYRPMTRVALASLLVLLCGVGCRQKPTGEQRRPETVTPGPDGAAVSPTRLLPISWRPVLATPTRALALLVRAGQALRAALVRALAGVCRLEGWNEEHTIGYRERGWGLQRRSGPRRTRRLVLTFDDGPMKKKTPRILDLLAKYQVKATFFLIGRVIHHGTYRLVRRILKEGHTLGNHSYHHLVEMHKHPQAAALIEVELELAQAMVDLALVAESWRDFRALRIRMLGGKAFGFARTLPGAWPAIRARWRTILAERRPDGQSPHRMIFARPPGGAPFSTRWRPHHRQQYARILRKLGLINVMWDHESGDSDRMLTAAERRNTDRLLEAISDGTKRGGVFLMHDRIGLGGLGRALGLLSQRKRVVLTDLPAAAESWYGCPAPTLSLVLQTLYALDYHAPAAAVVPPPIKTPKVHKRRRMRRAKKRPPQGLMPRRR